MSQRWGPGNHWCQTVEVSGGGVALTCRSCGESVDVAETAYQSLDELLALEEWHKAVAFAAELDVEFRSAAAEYGSALAAWAASDVPYEDAADVRVADLRFSAASGAAQALAEERARA